MPGPKSVETLATEAGISVKLASAQLTELHDFSYWRLYTKTSAATPRLAAFRSWLLSEAGHSAR